MGTRFRPRQAAKDCQLYSVSAERDQLANDLSQAQLHNTESMAKQAHLGIEIDMLRERAEKAENAAADLKAKTVSRAIKKSKAS